MLDATKFFAIALILIGSKAALGAPREINARKLAAAGVRVLDGKYVRVLTDLPSSAAVDELPAVFDAAVPLWAEYFRVPAAKLTGARWQTYVVGDRELFAALDLLPAANPEFKNGFATDWELWLVEQPSDYYRRHLLLHEGTHAFMESQLGGCGPGWYKEGMAELLGTHEWRDGRLKLGVFPANKNDFSMWGRIKLIRDDMAEGRGWPLAAVLQMDSRREMSTEQYAWTWALAALLDAHPRFQTGFRQLKEHVADPRFNDRFRELGAGGWSELDVEWSAYRATLDYGYDARRMAIEPRPAAFVGEAARQATVAADRGWQSTGWILKRGQSYRVTASGRYQIARDGELLSCEPGGVTIEYHEGHPLGSLLGALQPAHADTGGEPSFARPVLLGLKATLEAAADAVLYVRVNDRAATVGQNRGGLSLNIAPAGRQ
jgi:hypothetical protein